LNFSAIAKRSLGKKLHALPGSLVRISVIGDYFYTHLVGGIMRNNGRFTATEEMIAMSEG
jgi:hypothetical protein